MPTGNLPKDGKALWERVYDKALKGSCKDDEECAARTAWSAVKDAGWYKDKDGNWHKKAQLQEFSLTIKKVSQDPETGERRWRADASSIAEDSYKDNMTVRLFNGFVDRIEDEIEAPEPYRSEYWKGGMPYISVSHFPDLNGDAVPGDVKAVYVDGKYLKSKGTFSDTPLGRACWEAIKRDFTEDIPRDEKVRISIGFLDFEHVHKSNGYHFKREDENDMCPECLVELISKMFNPEFVYEGKSFMDGQLVHLALTRVPANVETMISPEMEVRSMTTQAEDAESIIGKELVENIKAKAEELYEDGLQEDKALVIKAEEDKEEVEPVEEAIEKYQHDGGDTEVDDEIDTQELIRDVVKSVIEEMNMPNEEPVVEEAIQEDELVEEQPHILAESFAIFCSKFDEVMKLDSVPDEKLQALQEPFNVFANHAVNLVKGEPVITEEPQTSGEYQEVTNRIEGLEQKMDLLIAQMSKQEKVVGVPERRSIDPLIVQIPQQKQEKMSSFRSAARKGSGLS